MVDREKVLSVLRKRFPDASVDVVAAAANAIVGLSDEWTELTGYGEEVAAHLAVRCSDSCGLAAECDGGSEFRLLKRTSA
jgi:hypothetical protein